jgi:hypothetical protein
MPQQGQPVIVDYNHTVSTNNATISYVNFLIDPGAKAINVDTLITGNNDNIIIFEAVCVSTPVATNVISEITGNHDTLKVEVIEFNNQNLFQLYERSFTSAQAAYDLKSILGSTDPYLNEWTT